VVNKPDKLFIEEQRAQFRAFGTHGEKRIEVCGHRGSNGVFFVDIGLGAFLATML